ncbi:MAG TPA: ABC transporter permease, partial [Terriglobales bacterium]|nr:ABC transporter permease [Terriglobales bacterium]
MDFVSVVRVALRALTRNKMRSILTMLGIIIGVGAVIAMVGVGQGASEQMQAQIAAMGSNLIIVQSGSRQAGVVHIGFGATKSLVPADEAAMLQEIPLIKSAAAGTSTHQQVISDNNNWGTSIQGTEPSYFDIRSWSFDQGGNFTDRDVAESNNVCILGTTVYLNLFPDGSNPVGRTIRIKNLPFTVVGTLLPKGQSGFGQDQDDNVYIPYTTLLKKLSGTYWLQNIAVSAISNDATDAAQQQITDLLRSR